MTASQSTIAAAKRGTMASIVDWLIEWPERTARHLGWLPPLAARITVGWVFMWSGWAKLNNLPQMIENFIGWGIPFPYVMTPFVSGVEFFGGLLLLLGLFTRIAAVPLVIVMIVAIISAKWDQIDFYSRRYSASRRRPTWRSSAGSRWRGRGRSRSTTCCSGGTIDARG